MGYMFAVKPVGDAFVARTLHALNTLNTLTYLDGLSLFESTLDYLFSWRNYQVPMKDIILESFKRQEKEKLFSSVFGSSSTATDETAASP